eukprot:360879-Chlamydomonas_euryale.AAC.5
MVGRLRRQGKGRGQHNADDAQLTEERQHGPLVQRVRTHCQMVFWYVVHPRFAREKCLARPEECFRGFKWASRTGPSCSQAAG